MSLDARYDQERKVCVCGCGYFAALQPVQVHAQPSTPGVALLAPYQDGDTVARIDRLPVAECVQCRTRYDRLWREVV
jgi:hypothetical protein